MLTHVLVVDDEPSIRNLLSRILEKEGYGVLLATTGREALELASTQKPDIVILDLNLPDMHGEDVCQKIRQNPAIQSLPVIILTGRTTEGLSARCLNGGADAYLPKPFEIEEILAHVKAVLRRTHASTTNADVIHKGQMMIRVPERMVFWKGRRIDSFSPKEFEILLHLLAQSPKVLNKNDLATKIWGVPHTQLNQRTMDVHMRRIRMKLGPAAAACLKTIPAIGFQWLNDPKSATLEHSFTP